MSKAKKKKKKRTKINIDYSICGEKGKIDPRAVSYTHLRAHETLRYLVCRLLLEKKKKIFNFLLILKHATKI